MLLALLLTLLTVQYLRRPARLDEPAVLHGQPIRLPTRIDPNTATAEQLTRIPHLGDKLAAKIIDYREARKPLTPDNIVFHAAEDLSHISGLGRKTLDQLRPYLQFPDDADTQPAP
jgi:competence ComEA-like helix-hairpin-helix protein